MEYVAEQSRMHPSRPLRLYKASGEASVCDAVLVAQTHWQRLRGLLGRPELQPGEGLLLLPSQGIHTVGMRYAIDAVLLDKHFQVIHIYEAVKPQRIRLARRGTHSVLELRAGEARRVGIAVGDCLSLGEPLSSAPHPSLDPSSELLAHIQPARLPGWLKLLLTVLLCAQVSLCWLTRAHSLNGQVDLRAYYTAGTLTRTGAIGNLYNDAAEQRLQQAIFHRDGWLTLHFLYPPFAVLPCVPLSLLPYRVAFFVAMAANLGCLFLCAWLLVREHPAWKLKPGTLFVFFLCVLPTAVALMQAQISFALLLIVTLFYRFERRGQPVLAGVCLAVGLAKFQLVLPVALLYLLWRRYRVVAGFGLGGAALLLLSVMLTGTAGLRAYATRLGSVGSSTLLDQNVAHLRYGMQVAFDPNLHGLATMLAGNGKGSALLTVAFSALAILWSIRQVPSVATAITVALLLSFHLQAYGLVLLLLPLTLLVMNLKLALQDHGESPARLRSAAWLLACSAALLSPPLAYWVMVRDTTVWFVLASGGTLVAAVLLAPKPAGHPAAPGAVLVPVLVVGNALP